MMLACSARLPVIFITLLLGACSSAPTVPSEQDPWESFNRSIYGFNESVDELVLKPVAETYRDVVPQFIRTGISNFISNLGDLLVIINDLLQLKIGQAGEDITRFLFNSTFGIFGLFDVATPLGLPKHDEDFGQTLGYWGLDSGPYLVLPFLGPSTVRDTGGLAVDYSINPANEFGHHEEQTAYGVIRIIDTRTNLLQVEGVLDAASFGDEYSFVRDAWLARRQHKVHDGASPENDELDDFDEDELLFEDDEL